MEYLTPVCSRYNTDGSLDTTFGTAGNAIINLTGTSDAVHGIVVQSDDIILAVAQVFHITHPTAVFRLNSNGTLDTSFATNGTYYKQMVDVGGDDVMAKIFITSNNKIIVTGSSYINGLGEYTHSLFRLY